MGIGTGIFLIAIGAILRYAISVQTDGFDLHSIGVILMVAGAATTLLSMVFWNSWGGFNRGERTTTVTERSDVV